MSTYYEPTWESLRTHPLPDWYDDAKLGIFIHWGLYSVPAWAEVTWELGAEPSDEEWFTHNPYAEWYMNTYRVEGSPAQKYHQEKYGKDFEYAQFADLFTAENWKPDEWAKLFKEAGAEYVVLTTKHHDGFCLYPSKYTDYNVMNHGAKRDLMGELTEAVRAEGLKMGAYYSGIYDWTTFDRPKMRKGTSGYYNTTYAFADYSYNQVWELIDKYHPAVLWNDVGWPEKGLADLPYLISHYYNTVPEGVINERWGLNFLDQPTWCDYLCAEYQTGTQTMSKKWEMSRGLGLSFGYNQNEGDETVLSGRDLVRLLVNYTAHNGNLLINIGPKADGTIPAIQIERLKALGKWMSIHQECIKGTRPWQERQQDDLGNGVDVFYTTKGKDLYAIVDHLPQGTQEVKLPIYDTTFTVTVEDEYPLPIKIENYFA